MIPIGFVLLIFGLVSALNGLAIFYDERATVLSNQRFQDYAAIVLDGLEQHRDIYQFYPFNLDALVSAEGFEHLKPTIDALSGRIHYLHAGQIQSGDGDPTRDVWSLETVRIGFTLDDTKRDSDDYFSAANNTCGSEPAQTAQHWCGEQGSLWSQMQDDKNLFSSERRVREHLNAIAAQLSSYYSAQSNREFPNPNSTNLISLAELAGLPTNVESCIQGLPSQWLGIPISCGSAFVEGGGAVFYKRFRKDHVILVAQTLSTKRWDGVNGQPITVVMEMNVGNF